MDKNIYKPRNLDSIKSLLSSVQVLAFDFDGVFTDNMVYVMQDGAEIVRCWRSDGIGIQRLRDLGVHMIILSAEVNPVVSARARKLKMECRQGLKDKAAAIMEFCGLHNVTLNQAAFVGNDINDLPVLKSVGLPIAVCDAHIDILPHVLYRTDRMGGCGAVREICDLIYHAKKGTLDTYESDIVI